MINVFNMTAALNYEEINWNLKRISNIKPFMNKYKWKGINYPSKKKIDDCKALENNNPTVALNILYIKENIRDISSLYLKN